MYFGNNSIYDSDSWWFTNQVWINRSLVCLDVKFVYFCSNMSFNLFEVLRLDFKKLCTVLKLIILADVELNARIMLIRQKEYLLVHFVPEEFPAIVKYIDVFLKWLCLNTDHFLPLKALSEYF